MDLIGQELGGHYKVLSKLGAGGMGVVYLAEDTRLSRKAALKLLPAQLSGDAEYLARFKQEARAISALNHPNILTIYEIGSGEAGHFIATEYIEGETLRQLMDRSRLDLPRILEIGMQLAAALSAAHDAGIVHRDIKPENIMLRADGYVKILDFGLAKPALKSSSASEDATGAGSLTSPGMVMGTVKYMSPEQARGLEVDHRTDLFSLGVVLYEMATGRLPFQGGTNSDTIAAILLQAPQPLNSFASNSNPEFQRILTRALAKNPLERYPRAQDLMADLNSLSKHLALAQETGAAFRAPASSAIAVQSAAGPAEAGTGSVSVTGILRRKKSKAAVDSIAILPLENGGADPNTDYLSDGITETLINSISRLPKLRVMARSTVFRFKGKPIDPMQIGHDLNVRSVLTGRVLPLGDKIVVKAELVDISDGSQIWGGQYRRQFSDIFQIEEEISQEIFENLRVKLSGEEKKKLARRSTENTEAYQLYLKGRYHWNKRTGEGLQKGAEYCQQAIAVDPSYAQAYIGLAEALVLQAWFSYGLRPARIAMPAAKAAATRALEIDGSLAEAYTSLALVQLLYDWDWKGSEESFRKAISLRPGYATLHHWYPILLTAAGRFDDALHEVKIALQLDPLSLMINATQGWIMFYQRRYTEAAEQLQKTLEMEASFPTAHWLLGQVLMKQGKSTQAYSEFETAKRLDPTPAILAGQGHALAESGRHEEALQVLEELNRMAGQRYVSPESQALIYAGLGKTDAVLDWLEMAFEERSSYMIYLSVDPRLDFLRDHPRFLKMKAAVALHA